MDSSVVTPAECKLEKKLVDVWCGKQLLFLSVLVIVKQHYIVNRKKTNDNSYEEVTCKLH